MDATTLIQHPKVWYFNVVTQLLLSTFCWSVWHNDAVAQLEVLPPEGSDDIIPRNENITDRGTETTVPTVETGPSHLRPTLEDLDTRILESSTTDVQDSGFNDSEFDQYRLGPGDGL
ncbi:MAG: hypothetical protein AAFY17_13210, partial [Cyanobacteria bacterium J06642_11]